MHIHLLGTVGLAVEGAPFPVRSHKMRTLLACLALDLGRPLSPSVLADRIWDGEPPATATATLQSHVSRLRSALRETDSEAARGLSQPIEIAFHSGTYVLRAGAEQVDWHHFRRLADRAATLAEAGDDRRALTLLREAEDVWQGDPLAGLPGEWARSARILMADRKLAAELTRAEIELRLGRFTDVVPELIALAADHPWNERISVLLMTALYGCDRTAEALSVYREISQRLYDDLGTRPGEALDEIYQRILRRVPASDLVRRPVAARGLTGHGIARPPSTLRAEPELVGREKELEQILAIARNVDRVGSRSTALPVVAISGLAGAGKTGLALAAAHRLREDFPDGQVFVPLGAHAGSRPLPSPEAAATELLRQFGVPAPQIPLDSEELLAGCRELLTGRRALVVLDDAAGPAQVRPLLPTAPASFVLVTSRHRMAELRSAWTMTVGELAPRPAGEMFRKLAGGSRVSAPEQAAGIAEVARLCGGHALALDLAASRFRAHPTWTLEHLIQRLSRADGRIGELHDALDSLEGAFTMSYQALQADHQTAFRRLCLHPGDEFGTCQAAALIGCPPAEVERVLDALLNVHLITEIAPERFGLPDLVGEFGRVVANRTDMSGEQSEALGRLAAFAASAARGVDQVVWPHRFRLPPPSGFLDRGTGDHSGHPDWRDEAAATKWLSAEIPGLIAMERQLRADGADAEASWLSHLLAPHLEGAGLWREAHQMHSAAAAFERRVGHRQREAHVLVALARIELRFARYPAAARCAERAVTLAGTLGDMLVRADAFERLAEVHCQQGDLTTALEVQREVLALRRSIGDQWPLARSLNNLAIFHTLLGDHPSAMRALREALPVFRKLKDSRSAVQLLNNLGGLQLSSGDSAAARVSFETLMDLDMGYLSTADLAAVRLNLALTLDIPKESRRAADLLDSAAHSFVLLGDARHEIDARTELGRVRFLCGDLAEAAEQYSSALDLAVRIGAVREEVAALRALGQVEEVMGTTAHGRCHLEQSIERARLAAIREEEALGWEALAESFARQGEESRAEKALRRAAEILAGPIPSK
ncbi:BTAD domain-containing putative transcriptional regulator [Kitasatospora griseola]|uniref:AfsR/SARP family transcriptional regulator n=1 Tax=Kitasatospora griseola TaxID=2064 RepID=UPI0036DD0C15